MHSYTAGELERATGFDRRTIAYYVQEGLLPKVGRRGSRTRYPKLVRDRLLFIRRVREAEQAGEVPPVSLSDVREIFETVPPELISSVADKQTSVTQDIVSPKSTRVHPPAQRRTALQERFAAMREASIAFESAPAMHASAPSGPRESEDEELLGARSSLSTDAASERDPQDVGERMEGVSYSMALAADHDLSEESALGDSLAALQEIAHRRRIHSRRSIDTWLRMEISPDIALAVRGVTHEDAHLLEIAGQSLRRLISRHSKLDREEPEELS